MGALAVIASLFAWGTASAAGFTAGPPIVLTEVAAGGSGVARIAVANGEAVPLSVTTTLQDWWVVDGQTVLGPPGARPDSAVPWTLPPPGARVLAPGETAFLDVHVQPPPSASGAYYAAVLVGAAPVGLDDASPPPVLVFTTLVALRIEGTGKESLALTDVTGVAPTASAPLHVRGRLACDGDVFSVLRPTALVLDAGGATVARIDGPEIRILPGQTKDVDLVWGGLLGTGTYSIFLTGLYADGQTTVASGTLTIAP